VHLQAKAHACALTKSVMTVGDWSHVLDLTQLVGPVAGDIPGCFDPLLRS
jgi:hypothetical protein